MQVELTATTGKAPRLTVAAGRIRLPVVKTSRYTGVVMAVTAYTAPVVDGVFLLESGDFLITESGSYLTIDGAATATVDLAFLTEGGDYLAVETGDLLLTA